jgi:hypothetical protein
LPINQFSRFMDSAEISQEHFRISLNWRTPLTNWRTPLTNRRTPMNHWSSPFFTFF